MQLERKYYHLITYGCQMNLHESEKLAGILSSLNYVSTNDVNKASVIVFNTCCIRENAEERAEGNIGALKKLKMQNKNLIIAVGGCMTQQKNYPQKLLKKFPFIDIIFGTSNLEDFGELLKQKLNSKKPIIAIDETEKPLIKEGTKKLRTSYPNAWVNIAYGCNNFCTYCIVPYVRGRERSRNIDDILAECRVLVQNGYKEITLLGQNVNSYGSDLENVNFSMLLDEVAKIEGDFRIRFMTNHPKDLSKDLVAVIKKHKKICNSIHLPIQSGSTKILKLMNRRYTKEDYLEKYEFLKKEIPDISITTDIMVGFPGETHEDYLDTLDVVKRCRFSGAFIFIYSKRKGTPAENMDNQVNEEDSKKRIMELLDVQNGINREESLKLLNKRITILCEGFDDKKQMYLGRDEHGRMGYFTSSKNLIGEFVDIKITKTGGISLIGEIVE